MTHAVRSSVCPHDCPSTCALSVEVIDATRIGAVRGAALGTGLAIAACCDVVVAGHSARFGTPEVGVGVMGGARHLARLVPQPFVRLMYFTADPLPAADLAGFGSVVQVVDDDQVGPAALALAARMMCRDR